MVDKYQKKTGQHIDTAWIFFGKGVKGLGVLKMSDRNRLGRLNKRKPAVLVGLLTVKIPVVNVRRIKHLYLLISGKKKQKLQIGQKLFYIHRSLFNTSRNETQLVRFFIHFIKQTKMLTSCNTVC